MSLTTVIVLNAVLDLLVIVALFRVMWFGILKPYDQPRELPRPATDREQLRRAA